MRDIDKELAVLHFASKRIGKDAVLTDDERLGLRILARAADYLEMRRSYGEEIWEREKRSAGKSTSGFDEEKVS